MQSGPLLDRMVEGGGEREPLGSPRQPTVCPSPALLVSAKVGRQEQWSAFPTVHQRDLRRLEEAKSAQHDQPGQPELEF